MTNGLPLFPPPFVTIEHGNSMSEIPHLFDQHSCPIRMEAINREYIDMPEVVDDKSAHCVSFIVDHMSKRSSDDAHQPPLFIGVNGPQGSGKSTLVSVIDRQHAT